MLGLNPVRDLVDYARRNGLEKRAQFKRLGVANSRAKRQTTNDSTQSIGLSLPANGCMIGGAQGPSYMCPRGVASVNSCERIA